MDIGIIGLGVMGRPMASHLMKRGHRLNVHARRPEAAADVVAGGAVMYDTPAELAAHSEVVITMVTATGDVEEVLIGDRGVVEGARAGSVAIDMSTISPDATRQIASTLERRGIHMLDAPVTGGPAGAANATLTIMVGGDAAILQRVRPVLECLGSKIVRVGPNGAGQIAKACNQLALLVNAEGAAEALALAARLGLDPSVVRDVLLGGIAASRVLEVFGARMAERQFEAGIESRLYDKDLNIVLDLARGVGQELPAAAVVRNHLDRIMAAQQGRKDLSVLIEIVERLSGRLKPAPSSTAERT
jgi:2-hydroxy-3-oxopropionate reductase